MSEQPAPCEHHRVDIVTGGLKRCDTCGAIQGVDGIWREP